MIEIRWEKADSLLYQKIKEYDRMNNEVTS